MTQDFSSGPTRGRGLTKGRGEGRRRGAASGRGGNSGSEALAAATAFRRLTTKIPPLWCRVTPPHGQGLAGTICRGNWSARIVGCGLMRGPSRRGPASRGGGLKGRSFCGGAARRKDQTAANGPGEEGNGGKGSVAAAEASS